MQVGEESRTVTVARKLAFSAQDLAQAAGLDNPDQWRFADSDADATATVTRTEPIGS